MAYEGRSEGFVMYKGWKGLCNLSDAGLASLMRAIFATVNEEEVNIEDINMEARGAYYLIVAQLKYDAEKYASVCEARREAGKKAHKNNQDNTKEKISTSKHCVSAVANKGE